MRERDKIKRPDGRRAKDMNRQKKKDIDIKYTHAYTYIHIYIK